MFRAKGIHIKSRLDECKKFDEECKLRYIAYKVMRDAKLVKISTVPKQLTIQEWIGKYKLPENHIGPKPAHINPFFGLNAKEKKALKQRIKLFKKESAQFYDGMEKFKQAILGVLWEPHK